MGDIRILDPRMDPRFGGDMKHRPWPAMYRNYPARGPSFCYRPMPIETLTQWITPHLTPHDYNYVPSGMRPKKGRDYYYLAPMYQNALPPPPPPSAGGMQISQMALAPPRMMLMEKSSRNGTKTSSSNGAGRSSVAPCTCSVGRTRSLEDVRSEVVEWEEYNDENGNRVKANAKNIKHTRRSMENLLDVDNSCSTTFNRMDKSPCSGGKFKQEGKECRRRGSYMVR